VVGDEAGNTAGSSSFTIARQRVTCITFSICGSKPGARKWRRSVCFRMTLVLFGRDVGMMLKAKSRCEASRSKTGQTRSQLPGCRLLDNNNSTKSTANSRPTLAPASDRFCVGTV
jgi:hypothetical protein